MPVLPQEKAAFLLLLRNFADATVDATNLVGQRGEKGAAKRERAAAKRLLKYYLGKGNFTEEDIDAVIGG